MALENIPHKYQDDDEVKSVKENMNHKYIEQGIWYHQHDGVDVEELKNVTIEGTLTTDQLVINNKKNFLKYFTHYDSGWRIVDTFNEFTNQGDFHQATFEHELGMLPTLSYVYMSADANQTITSPYMDEITNFRASSRINRGIEISGISSTEYTLKIGNETDAPASFFGFYYRVILVG